MISCGVQVLGVWDLLFQVWGLGLVALKAGFEFGAFGFAPC